MLVRHSELTPEEVATLRLSDLHLAGKRPNISVRSAEGDEIKSVDLDLEAHRALVGWLVARPDSKGDHLFPGSESDEMDPHNIRQGVKAAEQELEYVTRPVEPVRKAAEQEPESPISDDDSGDTPEVDDKPTTSPPAPADPPVRPAAARIPLPPTSPVNGH